MEFKFNTTYYCVSTACLNLISKVILISRIENDTQIIYDFKGDNHPNQIIYNKKLKTYNVSINIFLNKGDAELYRGHLRRIQLTNQKNEDIKTINKLIEKHQLTIKDFI